MSNLMRLENRPGSQDPPVRQESLLSFIADEYTGRLGAEVPLIFILDR